MIRELKKEDKDVFLSMVKEFYQTNAVLHSIPIENMVNTYEEAVSDSPFVKVYMIEHEDTVAGYGNLSFTYSNEVGGMVVLVEEIYIKEQFQGLGLGSRFLDYIKEEYDFAKRFRLELSEDNKRVAELYKKKGYMPLEYLQMVCDR